MNHTGRLVCSSVCLPDQLRHVPIAAESTVDSILTRKIECGARLACSVDPRLDGIITGVPIFTYTELRLAVFVIDFGILAAISLHHVEPKTRIAVFLHQTLLIILTVVLNIGVRMVEVSRSVEIVARIHRHLIA